MSTQTAQAIEFRCNHCWHTAQAPLAMEGQAISCPNCTAEVAVPEASAERLRDAAPRVEPQAPQSPTNPYAVMPSAEAEMSDAELMKLVQRENRLLPNGQMDFSGVPNASLLSRFFANMIDGFYVLAAMALGFVAVFAAAATGLTEMPGPGQNRIDPAMIMIFSFFPIVAMIVQWNLIATRGQSIGKFLLCIRMITMDGRLPGFVNGVILRDWSRALLGAFIPFFGLIDVLFIFSDSKRCIHDYIAGTRVVQVV